jgi:hypothetical protein
MKACLSAAIDSSVLLDIVLPDSKFSQSSRQALRKLSENNTLIISPVVLAEISVHFKSKRHFNKWYNSKPFKLEPDSEEVSWWASRFFRRYIKERSYTKKRLKILPDFFIAAHALVHAGTLLTRDKDFSKKYFKELKTISPKTLR